MAVPGGSEVGKTLGNTRQEPPVHADQQKEVDIYRDTPVRLLGYANELGEAFRSLVHVNVVRLTYAVASAYVLADTADKVAKADKTKCTDEATHRRKLLATAADTLVWQALASVIVPGFTINRVCALSLHLLKRHSGLTLNACKWTTTGIGLSCVPFIVSPIDHGIHALMDRTVRRWVPPPPPPE
ncbi:mitochondrial fission process protein 1 [Ixodes scapularis]|uniref:mitochondrial fission process protein 1 n=1 Tax=Ixodes scapularis TaxID=6945 RepID=UPI001C388753|nr:mitochondrial fission process protein 1 [Ixodes scapularis]